MDGSNFKQIKVLKTEDIPLYKDIKVINGALVYGEIVGTYSIFYLEDRNYNEPFVAVVLNNDSMDPGVIGKKKIAKGSLVLAEMDTPVLVGKLGIFSYNGECIIRKLKANGKSTVLEAFNEDYPDIQIEKEDDFYILGKVIESRIEADV